MFNDKWKLLILKEPNWTIDIPWWWLDHEESINTWLTREIQEETWCPTIIQWPICTRTRLNKNWIYYFFIWVACVIQIEDFQISDEAETYKFVWQAELKNNHRLEYIYNNFETIKKLYYNQFQ